MYTVFSQTIYPLLRTQQLAIDVLPTPTHCDSEVKEYLNFPNEFANQAIKEYNEIKDQGKETNWNFKN